MAKLRRKIEANPKEPQLLITVRGEGYKLMVAPEAMLPFLRRSRQRYSGRTRYAWEPLEHARRRLRWRVLASLVCLALPSLCCSAGLYPS